MATRLEIAQQLCKTTGNYDLVVDGDLTTCVDNGANWHINAGQRFLDGEFEYKGEEAWLYKKLTSGQAVVSLTRARSIMEVWVVGPDGKRRQLELRPLAEMRAYYQVTPLSSVTHGVPQFYCLLVPGLGPEQYSETANSLATAGMTDTDFLSFGNYYATDKIGVFPPVDGTYTVEILANCRSKELSSNSDVSFWSVNEPYQLVAAARLSVENDMRNTAGYNDILAPILRALKNLNKDLIREEAAGKSSSHRMLARDGAPSLPRRRWFTV